MYTLLLASQGIAQQYKLKSLNVSFVYMGTNLSHIWQLNLSTLRRIAVHLLAAVGNLSTQHRRNTDFSEGYACSDNMSLQNLHHRK